MSETDRLKNVVEENESNSRFHNFAECLCESYQREELVKALDGHGNLRCDGQKKY